MKERDHLKCEDVNWIYLAQNRDLWQALVNFWELVSITRGGGEFDRLNDYQLPMNVSAPWITIIQVTVNKLNLTQDGDPEVYKKVDL
jgi:hypothetical protein